MIHIFLAMLLPYLPAQHLKEAQTRICPRPPPGAQQPRPSAGALGRPPGHRGRGLEGRPKGQDAIENIRGAAWKQMQPLRGKGLCVWVCAGVCVWWWHFLNLRKQQQGLETGGQTFCKGFHCLSCTLESIACTAIERPSQTIYMKPSAWSGLALCAKHCTHIHESQVRVYTQCCAQTSQPLHSLPGSLVHSTC